MTNSLARAWLEELNRIEEEINQYGDDEIENLTESQLDVIYTDLEEQLEEPVLKPPKNRLRGSLVETGVLAQLREDVGARTRDLHMIAEDLTSSSAHCREARTPAVDLQNLTEICHLGKAMATAKFVDDLPVEKFTEGVQEEKVDLAIDTAISGLESGIEKLKLWINENLRDFSSS